jgi:hypothetical protein
VPGQDTPGRADPRNLGAYRLSDDADHFPEAWMRDFFEAGGWGMYPILIFGSLLLASVVSWIVRPQRKFAQLSILLAAATLGAGLLGVITGFHTTFTAAAHYAEPERLKLVLLGMSESMNNLTFALVFLVLSALLAAARALRPAAPQPAFEQRAA